MTRPRSKQAIKGTNCRNPDGSLDLGSGSGIVMSYEHHAVHEGLAYQVDDVLDVGAGSFAAIEFHVPAKVEMHMGGAAVWTTAAELAVHIREDPTIATHGPTPIPIVNRNRSNGRGSRKPLVGFFGGTLGITGGDTLEHPRMGGGGVGVAIGSDRRSAKGEWVLGGHSSERVYTVAFENQDNVQRRVSYTFFWHEIEEEDD